MGDLTWHRSRSRLQLTSIPRIESFNASLGIPLGAELLDDLVFVSTLLTQPAQLTVTSGNVAPVTVNSDAGVHVFIFTMGVGKQSFSITRSGRQILGGQRAKDITNSCQTYNFNTYVGKF
ncbi:hypothetical protein V8C37DRAFT_403392 [Trichoderma ceciliae]